MGCLTCLIMFSIIITPVNGCKTLFMFGDSNSDTGAGPAAGIVEIFGPEGETFFGHPAGRLCDGRLIIDFLAEKLKLPYLDPYMESIGTKFVHGANFAVAASHVNPGYCMPSDALPFPLYKQVNQFQHFKLRATTFYNTSTSKEPEEAFVTESIVPRPEDFSEALYIIDIGQNDISHVLKAPEEAVQRAITDIVGTMSIQIKRLADAGAKFFWVHNTGPIGCLPKAVANFTSQPDDRDQHGCVQSANKVAQEFNRELKHMLSELRMQLRNTSIMYVDVYTAKYQLVGTAEKEGFVNPFIACRPPNNGNSSEDPCKQPWRHIIWDGAHYSEAANRWVANQLLDGSFSDPPLPIEEACLRM